MANPQPHSGLVAQFEFDGNVENSARTPMEWALDGNPSYPRGLQGRALTLGIEDGPVFFTLPAKALPVRVDRDFSVQFWMRTEAEFSKRFVLLSTKEFPENNVPAQRESGWTATDLQRHSGTIRAMDPFVAMQPWQGALPTLYAATAGDVKTGDYYGPHGILEMRGYPVRVGTTKEAKDRDVAGRLWKVSEEMTGVSFEA